MLEVDQIRLKLLFGDVPLGVETDVAVLLDLLSGQPLREIGVTRLQLSGFVGGVKLRAHAL